MPPFQSESQRRYLWAKEPKIAEKWAHEYPNQKNLPMHKSPRKETNHLHNRKMARPIKFH